MKKPARILSIVFASIIALLLLVMSGLQIFLNSDRVRKIVDEKAAKAINASLSYSRLRFDVFGSFPAIRLSLDSVSLTYPRERFTDWDNFGEESPLLNAGRGAIQDTLAAFEHFTLAVNPWPLVNKKWRLRDAALSGLKVYAHAYPDSSANWQIFTKDKDTTDKAFSLPPLSLGPVRIFGKPKLIYTSLKDSLYASAEMREMSLRGEIRFSNGEPDIRGLRFLLDSLVLSARRASDSLAFFMENLHLQSPRRNTIDIDAAARALLAKEGIGALQVPINLSAGASYIKTDGKGEIELRHFLLQLSDIPVKASGVLRMLGDSNYVKAALRVDDGPIGKNLELLADSGFVPIAKKIRSEAKLNFSAEAEGYISKTELPRIKADLSVPHSALLYKPMGLEAHLGMEIDAEMSPSKLLCARIKKLRYRPKEQS